MPVAEIKISAATSANNAILQGTAEFATDVEGVFSFGPQPVVDNGVIVAVRGVHACVVAPTRNGERATAEVDAGEANGVRDSCEIRALVHDMVVVIDVSLVHADCDQQVRGYSLVVIEQISPARGRTDESAGELIAVREHIISRRGTT